MRIWIEKITEIFRSIKNKQFNFKLNSIKDRQPVQRALYRGDMISISLAAAFLTI